MMKRMWVPCSTAVFLIHELIQCLPLRSSKVCSARCLMLRLASHVTCRGSSAAAKRMTSKYDFVVTSVSNLLFLMRCKADPRAGWYR